MITSLKKGVRGLSWITSEGADKWLPVALLDDPKKFLRETPPVRVIKESPVRSALIVSALKRDLFLKRYKVRGIKEGLKYSFIPSKAQREWVMARLAVSRGIPTPLPFAVGEARKWGVLKEAFLITQAISVSLPLIELVQESEKDDYIWCAARLIKMVHEAGLFHQDLHAGNILVQRDEGQLYLIDLHRCKAMRKVSERRRLWNLAQFLYSINRWMATEERERFLRLYYNEGQASEEKPAQVLKNIEMLQKKIHRRHIKSRTKRCLKNSGGFFTLKRKAWQIWARRRWKVEELLEIIQIHKSIAEEKKEGLIKDDRRTTLTLLEFAERRICVKEYRYESAGLKIKALVQGSKARKGWFQGNGLLVRGIEGINPEALLQKRRWGYLQESFLIMETLADYLELKKYLGIFKDPHRNVARKRAFIKGLAAFMANLYKLEITHRDLKISNIMVKEDGNTWYFTLTDWEDLRLDKHISDRRIIKGLVQMNTSTPFFISLKDRIRFLKEYCAIIGKDEIRALYRVVIKRSEKRGWATFI